MQAEQKKTPAAEVTIADISAALGEFNELSLDEYGISLEKLLLDGSQLGAQRMQRLTGIMLKQKFARPAAPTRYSATKARRSWPWSGSPESAASLAPKEFAILEELRKPGPWNKRHPQPTAQHGAPVSWDTFMSDAEHERGLFKVLALYANDRVRKRNGKSFRDYLEAEESRKFEAGLDLTMLVFDAAIMGPLAAVLGLPTVAVGVVLVGVRYGYRKLTDPNEDRNGRRKQLRIGNGLDGARSQGRY